MVNEEITNADQELRYALELKTSIVPQTDFIAMRRSKVYHGIQCGWLYQLCRKEAGKLWQEEQEGSNKSAALQYDNVSTSSPPFCLHDLNSSMPSGIAKKKVSSKFTSFFNSCEGFNSVFLNYSEDYETEIVKAKRIAPKESLKLYQNCLQAAAFALNHVSMPIEACNFEDFGCAAKNPNCIIVGIAYEADEFSTKLLI